MRCVRYEVTPHIVDPAAIGHVADHHQNPAINERRNDDSQNARRRTVVDLQIGHFATRPCRSHGLLDPERNKLIEGGGYGAQQGTQRGVGVEHRVVAVYQKCSLGHGVEDDLQSPPLVTHLIESGTQL